MDFTVRAAYAEEFGAVGELTGEVYLRDGLLDFGESDGYLRTLRDAATRAAQAELLVAADQNGTLLGTVTYVGDGGPYAELAGESEAEFRMLAVDGAARSRGVGEALVRACVDRTRERGRTGIVICSQPHMHAAHRLYTRLGFHRAPARDWNPIEGVDITLQAFTLAL
ncbi:GNAT family N-acetyltransferase [Streptomyces sp. NPDC048172]|uniref:GNAT family N-acetyltransferase n=1 Tax=Streptomyces sp. NPDC048172 TaxID=3365505 RepID=UPI003720752B